MTAQSQPKMTVDDYLAWSATQPEEPRTELVRGRIVAQAPQRLAHIAAKVAVVLAFANALRRAGLCCHAVGDGATVRVSDTTAFEPDALVYCGPELPGSAIEVPNPVVTVKVISPGSEGRDMRDKLAGYFEVESVQHYLIVDPDERLVIHHARGEGNVRATRILHRGMLRLDPPGFEFDVGEIFK